MLLLVSKQLEVRGVSPKESKNGNRYYVLNVETNDGEPHALYVPNGDVFPKDLKKGDLVTVDFEVSYFKGNPKLTVHKLHRL